jgi:hypothetical protein
MDGKEVLILEGLCGILRIRFLLRSGILKGLVGRFF